MIGRELVVERHFVLHVGVSSPFLRALRALTQEGGLLPIDVERVREQERRNLGRYLSPSPMYDYGESVVMGN